MDLVLLRLIFLEMKTHVKRHLATTVQPEYLPLALVEH